MMYLIDTNVLPGVLSIERRDAAQGAMLRS